MSQILFYCPQIGTQLSPASANIVKALNDRREQQGLNYINGESVEGPVSSLLVNEDQSFGYLKHNDIPRLLPGLAMSLKGLNTVKSVD